MRCRPINVYVSRARDRDVLGFWNSLVAQRGSIDAYWDFFNMARIGMQRREMFSTVENQTQADGEKGRRRRRRKPADDGSDREILRLRADMFYFADVLDEWDRLPKRHRSRVFVRYVRIALSLSSKERANHQVPAPANKVGEGSNPHPMTAAPVTPPQTEHIVVAEEMSTTADVFSGFMREFDDLDQNQRTPST